MCLHALPAWPGQDAAQICSSRAGRTKLLTPRHQTGLKTEAEAWFCSQAHWWCAHQFPSCSYLTSLVLESLWFWIAPAMIWESNGRRKLPLGLGFVVQIKFIRGNREAGINLLFSSVLNSTELCSSRSVRRRPLRSQPCVQTCSRAWKGNIPIVQD